MALETDNQYSNRQYFQKRQDISEDNCIEERRLKLTTSNKPDRVNNNMDKTDKKERWSKKQIIGIIAGDIEKKGKLGNLIMQILKSKPREVKK